MKFWWNRVAVFLVAGVLYLVGQYFRGYWFPNFTWPFSCQEIHFGTSVYCNPIYLETLGWPLIVAGEFLALVGVVLLFANERGFRAWLKFSLYYIPIAAALTLWIFPLHLGFGFDLNTTVPISQGVNDFGKLYLLITLGIVLWRRFRP